MTGPFGGISASMMASAANRPLEKWARSLLDTPETMCNKIGSGRCHCFSDTFITLYRRYLKVSDDQELQCAKWQCTEKATDGAHLRFGKNVFILPLCSGCNKSGADDCFKITRSRYPKALKLYCCCFNTGSKVCCHCDECTRVNCNTCRCRTREDGRCTCQRKKAT